MRTSQAIVRFLFFGQRIRIRKKQESKHMNFKITNYTYSCQKNEDKVVLLALTNFLYKLALTFFS